MRYQGSKRLLAKYLLPIVLKDRKETQYYIEPFVGGANMLQFTDGPRIANDNNYFLIEMYKALQRGWLPPSSVSKDEYENIRKTKDAYPPELVGFVGFGCSYAGKWFGGYATDGNEKREPRNYCLQSRNAVIQQLPSLMDVTFYNKQYYDFPIPEKSIVYCDPPYASTTKYKADFNYGAFWFWAKNMTKKGHKVFVSEYSAPDGWTCIWEKEVTIFLEKDKNKSKEDKSNKRVEKLFIYGE